MNYTLNSNLSLCYTTRRRECIHAFLNPKTRTIVLERINPFPTDGLYVYDKLEFNKEKIIVDQIHVFGYNVPA